MTDTVTPEILETVAEYMESNNKPSIGASIRHDANSLRIKNRTPGRILWEIVTGLTSDESWNHSAGNTKALYEEYALQFIEAMKNRDLEVNPAESVTVPVYDSGRFDTVTLTPQVKLLPFTENPEYDDTALLPVVFRNTNWCAVATGSVVCGRSTPRAYSLLVDPRG